MAPAVVSVPGSSTEAHTLKEVLMIAGQYGTEPFCSSYGFQAPFAALITAQDASGNLQAAWVSEPMFGTPKAALNHAEDLCGPEIWPIISGCSEW